MYMHTYTCAHTNERTQAYKHGHTPVHPVHIFNLQFPSCPAGVRCSRDYPAMGSGTGHRRGRGGKRLKHQESSEQRSSQGGRSHVTTAAAATAAAITAAATAAAVPLNLPLGPPTTSSSWPSVASQSGVPAAPFAPGMLPIYPMYPPLAQPFPQQVADPSRFPLAPMVTPPMMAFVLPNYMFPQMGAAAASPGHFYNPNLSQLGANVAAAAATSSNPVPVAAMGAPSRSSTPHSYCQTPAERDGAESPLFQSRCSSPLNLLQLEESPSNRLEVATALGTSQQATPSAQGGAAAGQSSANKGSSDDTSKENENVSAGHFMFFLFLS